MPIAKHFSKFRAPEATALNFCTLESIFNTYKATVPTPLKKILPKKLLLQQTSSHLHQNSQVLKGIVHTDETIQVRIETHHTKTKVIKLLAPQAKVTVSNYEVKIPTLSSSSKEEATVSVTLQAELIIKNKWKLNTSIHIGTQSTTQAEYLLLSLKELEDFPFYVRYDFEELKRLTKSKQRQLQATSLFRVPIAVHYEALQNTFQFTIASDIALGSTTTKFELCIGASGSSQTLRFGNLSFSLGDNMNKVKGKALLNGKECALRWPSSIDFVTPTKLADVLQLVEKPHEVMNQIPVSYKYYMADKFSISPTNPCSELKLEDCWESTKVCAYGNASFVLHDQMKVLFSCGKATTTIENSRLQVGYHKRMTAVIPRPGTQDIHVSLTDTEQFVFKSLHCSVIFTNLSTLLGYMGLNLPEEAASFTSSFLLKDMSLDLTQAKLSFVGLVLRQVLPNKTAQGSDICVIQGSQDVHKYAANILGVWKLVFDTKHWKEASFSMVQQGKAFVKKYHLELSYHVGNTMQTTHQFSDVRVFSW